MLYEMTLWLIAMCMVMAFAALQMPEYKGGEHTSPGEEASESFDHDGTRLS